METINTETKLESLPLSNFSPEKEEVEILDGEHMLVEHDPTTIKVSQLKEVTH